MVRNPRHSKFLMAHRDLSVAQRLDRIDRNLLNLKVSHSKLRMQVGRAELNSETLIERFAQVRADIHEFRKDMEAKLCQR